MNKFTLGAVAGMTTLIIAVPVIAQISSAATEDVITFSGEDLPTPTQECLVARVALEEAHLANFDTQTAAHKQQMQAHVNGLKAASQIADEDARNEALKDMREDMHVAMEALHESQPEAITAAMEGVKEACGDAFGFGHGMFMKAIGPMRMGMAPHAGKFMVKLGEGEHPEFILEKLGMTAEELDAAIESGKTIQDIAEEKGIEIPAKGKRMHFFKFDHEADVDDETNE